MSQNNETTLRDRLKRAREKVKSEKRERKSSLDAPSSPHPSPILTSSSLPVFSAEEYINKCFENKESAISTIPEEPEDKKEEFLIKEDKDIKKELVKNIETMEKIEDAKENKETIETIETMEKEVKDKKEEETMEKETMETTEKVETEVTENKQENTKEVQEPPKKRFSLLSCIIS